jgi:STE24 endopeptidase
MHKMYKFLLIAGCLLFLEPTLAAEVATVLPPGVVIPEAAKPGPNFDRQAATQAYLELLTPEQRARSDAYFEGGYWLQLWNWLATVIAVLIIVLSGWSARIRDWAVRRSRRPWLQTFLFAVVFLALLWILTIPLTIYEDFIRQHRYGLSNLTFGAWFFEELKALAFVLIGLGLFLTAVYALVRRAGAGWWAWATGFTFVFLLFVILVTPVFINPAFNEYKPLPPGETRDSILSLARANQIPADNVAWYDASKQTSRIGAHVSGLLGTTEIALNDNLLEKTSLPEIKAVMAHEMGHYVLNHGLRHAVYLALLFGFGFLVLDRALSFVIARWGPRLGVRDRADPAGMPIAVGILTTYLFLVIPLQNQIIHAGEVEADLYGLNAAREPHGFATVAMRLASHRKLEPGPVEKWLFYDHPSGRDRVEMSMRWLAENQQSFGPESPSAE